MRFSIEDLSAVLECASKDETRFNICGVRFSPSYLTATDGHTLARVTLPTDPTDAGRDYAWPLGDDGKPVGFTLERPALAPILASLKAHKKHPEPFAVVVEAPPTQGGKAVIQLPDGSRIEPISIAGDFPNVDQVIPAFDGGYVKPSESVVVPIGFDARYLARLVKAVKVFSRVGNAKLPVRMTLTSNAPNNAPVCFQVSRVDDGAELLALVMPMRC